MSVQRFTVRELPEVRWDLSTGVLSLHCERIDEVR